MAKHDYNTNCPNSKTLVIEGNLCSWENETGGMVVDIVEMIPNLNNLINNFVHDGRLVSVDDAPRVKITIEETPRSGMTQSGYGNRLPTSMLIRLSNEKIWRRVYCRCYSNAGTFYLAALVFRFIWYCRN